MAGLPLGYDCADPGDPEITFLHDGWLRSVDSCSWGAAAEYRQMYLQLLRRRDQMKRQEHLDIAAGRLTEQQAAQAYGQAGPPDPA